MHALKTLLTLIKCIMFSFFSVWKIVSIQKNYSQRFSMQNHWDVYGAFICQGFWLEDLSFTIKNVQLLHTHNIPKNGQTYKQLRGNSI